MDQLKQQDFPDDSFVFIGDFNVHNGEWIVSESKTDEAGEMDLLYVYTISTDR